mmetsp:Transcript_19073/g.27476  ORF Transcript_19073/g.27476 Transcript_19073/m.27476 type:complete len:92 (-) Transcript_19073:482-757(-)
MDNTSVPSENPVAGAVDDEVYVATFSDGWSSLPRLPPTQHKIQGPCLWVAPNKTENLILTSLRRKKTALYVWLLKWYKMTMAYNAFAALFA